MGLRQLGSAGRRRVLLAQLDEILATERSKEKMAIDRGRGGLGGISLGGILVIIGIVVLIFWSFWLGLIIALIGLIAFGGFARGRWY
ncbi:hypothetical protein BH18ACT12_BH18ACT12_14130 [soil metagenome]